MVQKLKTALYVMAGLSGNANAVVLSASGHAVKRTPKHWPIYWREVVMNYLLSPAFKEQFGYFIGEESEATHYSTFGQTDWKLRVVGKLIFYWDSLAKSWRKWPLTVAHCTPIGEQEPNFRCGPIKPKDRQQQIYVNTVSDVYYPNRGRSHIAGD